LTDWFIRRTGSRKWGRRLFGVCGHCLCALCCFLAFLYPEDAFSVFLFISLGAFWNDLTMGASWAACQDIGKRYAAIVAGCMNFIGNLGGAVVGKVTGIIIRQTLAVQAAGASVTIEQLTSEQRSQAELLGYKINFFMFGVAYLLAVAFWLYFDSTKPVVPDEGENQ
jgi:hypothetical protein